MLANNFIQLMLHALGGSVSNQHDLMATFNRAGRDLVECHEWNWRHKSVDIPTVAGQNYVDGPEDFGELEDATVPDSGVLTYVEATDWGSIQRMRAQTSIPNPVGKLWVCFDRWSDARNSEDFPRARFELYPTPTSDADPVITVSYRKTWTRIRPEDTLAQPDVPQHMEQALVVWSRMLAVAIENVTEASLPGITQVPEIARLISRDGMRQIDQGRVIGNVARKLAGRRYDYLDGDLRRGIADLTAP